MRPLVVDLDGTLIKTDLLAETASTFLVQRPLRALQLVAWLAQGRAELKAKLARAVQVDVSVLPYHAELLAWLRGEKAKGRRIVLATAADRVLADRVADHLQLFEHVLATEGKVNLKAGAKRDALVQLYGEGGFEYIGDDESDLVVWRSASQAHMVSGSADLRERVRPHGNLGRIFAPDAGSPAIALLKAMRPHQWLKNLLLFVALFAAHLYGSTTSVMQAGMAFLAFGLAASSVYLLNDLVDVTADRRHASKRHRPLAAGELSLVRSWLAWPLLLVAACGLALPLPRDFMAILLLYVLASSMYSLWLKRVPVLDVLMLAGLYTLRIVAGAAAIAVPLSFWLLAFSMFVFLSLAFMKRYAELKSAREADPARALQGRGYSPQDLELVSSLGTAAGQVAVLVLALYIQDAHTSASYTEPRFIWLACPLVLYWISRAWMIAHRGRMHHDPILFALRDRVSWGVAVLLGAVFILAKSPW